MAGLCGMAANGTAKGADVGAGAGAGARAIASVAGDGVEATAATPLAAFAVTLATFAEGGAAADAPASGSEPTPTLARRPPRSTGAALSRFSARMAFWCCSSALPLVFAFERGCSSRPPATAVLLRRGGLLAAASKDGGVGAGDGGKIFICVMISACR